MLRDVEYFNAKLNKIDGFGNSGRFLADTISAKDVERLPDVVPLPTRIDRTSGDGAAGTWSPSGDEGQEKERA